MQKMAELKRMGDVMLSRTAVLEVERVTPSGLSSVVGTPVNQQRRSRMVEQQHGRSSLASTSTQTRTTGEEAEKDTSAAAEVD